MNTRFKHLLGDATRLTRQGDLASATRAIREALGASGTTVHGRTAPEPRRRPSPPPPPPSDDAGSTVLDGEWRRVGDGVDRDGVSSDASAGTAPRGAPSDAAGAVSRARHEGTSGSLDYRLFVPPLAPGAPAPALLVMLHGCTQDAEDFATGTGMDALAREHGFLVLYPEQSSRANPQRCWNWFKDVHQRRGRGEPGMIEETVRAVVAEHGVDPSRVFVAGLSAGGAMAAILGELCPDLFAAVGVHSGLAAGSARDLPGALAAMRGGQGPLADAGLDVPVRRTASGPATRQPPTIVFHGDADRTVHPDNGERVARVCLDGLPTASEAERAPERRNGEDGGRGWSRTVHRDANGAVVVEHWRVHGAGHAWSGGDARGSYADAAGPDASAEMVRFFLRRGE